MQSKNKPSMTVLERDHVSRVKASGCASCQEHQHDPVVEAHEIEQGQWFTSIGLCAECHRGPNGLHGTGVYMRIRKQSELSLLNETLRRIASMR